MRIWGVAASRNRKNEHMVFEHIEELKRKYTDKFVVVDASRPDLRRFEGFTGTVKTVNMSGKALVQFDAYDNIGWFDIDVHHLNIIDKPLPKPEVTQKEAKQAPAEKKPAAAAAKPPASKMSVQEMLAAARGQKSGDAAQPSGAAQPAAQPTSMSTADVLAAARGQKPATTAEPAETRSEAAPATAAKSAQAMSTAEILAAARSGKSAAQANAPAPAAKAVTQAPVTETPISESVPAESATPAAVAETTPRADLPTTVAEIVAFCRQRDQK